MNMDDSREQNKRQGPSGSRQLSLTRAEKEAGDDRFFALAGLCDDVDGEDDVSTRAHPPRKSRKLQCQVEGTEGGTKLSHRRKL